MVRQVVLERLTGQHLALMLYQARKDVAASSLAEIVDQRKEAISAAIAQEEELYQRGKASKSVGKFSSTCCMMMNDLYR